jgi:predicted  nucleic acid-binding Zn-ribbon protein
MSKVKSTTVDKDGAVEERLRSLYELQQIDSAIDKLRIVRGELPLEVSDLEDEVTGLDTRIKNLTEELNSLEDGVVQKKQAIKDSQALIKKYEAQQSKVRNNREYDSISKEMEFQNLDIQLSEKRIKEYKAGLVTKNEILDQAKEVFEERNKDLNHKKKELKEIIAETEKEEETLLKKSKNAENKIEERLVNAYKRIRSNSRNGLAVVTVERDSCGGCFNKIPPQTHLDIKMHKKIIVCEHCGRILVDADILTGKK